jgi:hypothetical protein
MTTIRCPHCGTVNRARSNYCNNCGTDLRSEAPQFPPGQEPGFEPPPADLPAEDRSNPPLADELTVAQPWLQPQEDEQSSPPDPMEEATPPRRLIANVQGLLEPVRLINQATDETGDPSPPPLAPPLALEVEQLRRWRTLLSEEPALLATVQPPALGQLPNLRLPWLFLLFGGLVALAFVLGTPLDDVASSPAWPGVESAFATIDALPFEAPVLLVWGYDPATAGELDLLALPLVAHLRARQSRLLVVSLLPNGLATARRLFGEAIAPEVAPASLQLSLGAEELITGVFLPGGPGALPLLGQDLATGLNVTGAVSAAAQAVAAEPALVVLLAAQGEDVQQWLEQVQPLDRRAVVAFTSAAADPILRPYLATGQLQGLVSGFDGAVAYAQQEGLTLLPEHRARLNQQRTRQLWGQAALLLVIVLGNLAALVGTQRHG